MKLNFKENWIQIADLNTQYFTIGEGKRTLLILHGWAQDIDVRESFTTLLQELNQYDFFAEYTVILPHYPGFGDSDMPPSSGWSTHNYSHWLESFIKQTKINTQTLNILTHSFGGRILVRYLTKHPQFKNKVVLSASAGIKWPLSFRQKISVWLSKTFKRSKHLLPQKIQKLILNRVFGARDWGAVKSELKPTLQKVLEEPDFREDLQSIKNPVQLIWGAKDRITPLKSGQVFETVLPNVTMTVFPEGKHGIHRTHSQEIAAVIQQFLGK